MPLASGGWFLRAHRNPDYHRVPICLSALASLGRSGFSNPCRLESAAPRVAFACCCFALLLAWHGLYINTAFPHPLSCLGSHSPAPAAPRGGAEARASRRRTHLGLRQVSPEYLAKLDSLVQRLLVVAAGWSKTKKEDMGVVDVSAAGAWATGLYRDALPGQAKLTVRRRVRGRGADTHLDANGTPRRGGRGMLTVHEMQTILREECMYERKNGGGGGGVFAVMGGASGGVRFDMGGTSAAGMNGTGADAGGGETPSPEAVAVYRGVIDDLKDERGKAGLGTAHSPMQHRQPRE